MPADRTTFNRWTVVAVLVLAVVAVPVVARALPAKNADISAADLLARVRESTAQSWSGYAETDGTLQLPVTQGDFTGLSALLGESTQMRAWWRGEDSWRVDDLATAGETDLVHGRFDVSSGALVTAEWTYEKDSAVVDEDPRIRLPRTGDLIPPVLGKRVIAGVTAEDVSRIGATRVAGRDAIGLRVRPPDAQSSVDHVDLWADRDTGVPLLVEVYDAPGGSPAFTSRFDHFSSARPAASTTDFAPPAEVKVRFDGTLDIADTANQYARLIAPPSFGGLPKSKSADRAVGVYGSGLTQVIAIPLRGREAGPLRDQLKLAPGAVATPAGEVVTVGPLSVMLTGEDHDGGFLVAGTVTTATLAAGARDLAEHTTYLDFR